MDRNTNPTWVDGLVDGDESAIQGLWRDYFERLIRLARRKLGDANRRMADEEDVALSAFHSLCRGAAAGRFPELHDRDALWRLLVTITARKATAHLRREHRQKRGGGRVRGESVLAENPLTDSTGGLAAVLGKDPTPALAAELNEQCNRLLDCLNDGALRSIALFKLEGYTNAEIAVQLGYDPRTIDRKVAKIRERWVAAAAGDEA